ncbi:MAG: RdgB/HAM1 family non-canonical purine NTP pyrophosphatase [Betaproteobacteria bacterium]|nr:RdgB/HAM1 family non-canonical purine NTP pyrophosphatase [Betaproteobacteria bacterium]MDE2211340.1 RdgB/HAM1 family non-canonical purine NTP pyrophosphatase [Betaproteobacteria bacterium]MDE2354213.1 RdgB/HAM1 family non-canonical purine NTP pyrophosphatase [Betaproteobacteria bacterium]
MKRLVLASRNPGKLRELQALLQPVQWEVVPQDDLGISEAPEPHPTFVENALSKARHAAAHSAGAALADDSGLCVPALGGAPGVISAHYAGEPKSDERNNRKLVEALRDVKDRRAHYHCVLVLLRSAEDPEPLIAEGRWEGEVVLTPQGSGGFGYDPYFYLPSLGCTVAQLEPAEKNRFSHRALALRRLLELLRAGTGA